MMRKVNFAASVKEKTPHIDVAGWLLSAIHSNILAQYMLRIC
jgi:hypothetical protein